MGFRVVGRCRMAARCAVWMGSLAQFSSEARVVRLSVERTESMAAAVKYERLPGRFFGELDPADALYQLVYTARDPLVLGIGLAATRDQVSFLRYAAKDDEGNANPVAGVVKHAISEGNSQSGNFIKTFLHLGFNQGEDNRIVWDEANPNIAARAGELGGEWDAAAGQPLPDSGGRAVGAAPVRRAGVSADPGARRFRTT